MNLRKMAAVAAAGLLAAVLALPGCAEEAQPPANRFDPYNLDAGTAVTVNGVQIGEGAVTAYLENFRAVNDLMEEDAWGTWLMDNGYNPESIRDATVDMFVSQELVRQAAADRGLAVTDEEVDAAVQEMRDSSGSDEEWAAALDDMGLTEEEYRAEARLSLLQGKLSDDLGDGLTAADDELLSYVQMTYPDYKDAESLDAVDADVLSEARASMDYFVKQRAFSDFMMAFEEDSDIQKNGLPEGASYWIDLTPYEEAYYAEASGGDAGVQDAGGDGTDGAVGSAEDQEVAQ